jgi:tripartite-type tricarboxylate transporter receptor subunit TctC
MDEAGLKGYQVSAWFGLAAPTGLPATVQMRLEQALQNVAHQADTKASMVKVGAVRQDHA